MRKHYNPLKLPRTIGAIWGILGVVLILGSAIIRILPHVFDAFQLGLTFFETIVLVVWVPLMVITEGYRGFQKSFSPRIVSRAWRLTNHGQSIELILAPLYCIGYFHATRKRMITSWSLTSGIILLVFIVHTFPQPWRGIIDSGVVAGLLYGLMWVFIFVIRTSKNPAIIADPEINGII